MSSIITSWQAIAASGSSGTLFEIAAIVGRLKASNFSMAIGACCSNTTQSIASVACSKFMPTSTSDLSGFCLSEEVGLFIVGALSKIGSIGAPISFVFSVGGAAFRYVAWRKSVEQSGEAISLVRPAAVPGAQKSLPRKIADLLSSKAAQIVYTGLGVTCSAYSLFGSQLANSAASNLGACIARCSELAATYSTLSTLFTVAQCAVPVIVIIEGVAYAYWRTKPQDPPPSPAAVEAPQL